MKKEKGMWWLAAGALALMTASAVADTRPRHEERQQDPSLREKWRQAELWEQCNQTATNQ